jgi:DHA2 family multidrug resistance protein
VTFAMLDPSKRGDGTGLYYLSRNIGASVGIFVMSYLLTRNEPINHALIGDHVTASNRTLEGDVLRTLSPWAAGGRASLDAVVRN